MKFTWLIKINKNFNRPSRNNINKYHLNKPLGQIKTSLIYNNTTTISKITNLREVLQNHPSKQILIIIGDSVKMVIIKIYRCLIV